MRRPRAPCYKGIGVLVDNANQWIQLMAPEEGN